MKSKYLSLLLIFFVALSGCFRPVEESNNDAEVATTLQATYAPSEIDPCVVGVWTMDVFALEQKFLAMDVSPQLHVQAPSLLTMELRADNTFALFGMVTMRFEIPGGTDYIEMDATHAAQGGYSANGSTITFVGVDHDITYGSGRAFIAGELTEDSPLLESNSTFTAPVFEYPDSTSYSCSGNVMTLSYGSPYGSPLTEEWTKQP